MSAVFPRGPLEPDPDEIRAVTGRDAEREQLAAALVKVSGFAVTHTQVDALLPVVDRIAKERAAAELEAAADALHGKLDAVPNLNGGLTLVAVVTGLRARAAALRATTSGEGL